MEEDQAAERVRGEAGEEDGERVECDAEDGGLAEAYLAEEPFCLWGWSARIGRGKAEETTAYGYTAGCVEERLKTADNAQELRGRQAAGEQVRLNDAPCVEVAEKVKGDDECALSRV